MDQKIYNEKYNNMVDHYNELKERYDANNALIEKSRTAVRTLDEFARALAKSDIVTEFDESLWSSMVDYMTAYSKDDVRITFKDGTEVIID